MNTDAQALVDQITSDYKTDKLAIPSLPDIALRVRAAVDDDDMGTVDVAKIIQLDPGLAARVIRVANSAGYASRGKANTCQEAVGRLGMSAVRDVVFALVLRGLFVANNADLKQRMAAAWKRSIRVAAISGVLGGLAPKLDPERAMLAGLVHNVGIVPILAYASRFPAVSGDRAVLESVIRQLQPMLSSAILKKWGFGADLVVVPKEITKLQRDSGARADYADVVLLATIFSTFGTGQPYKGPPVDELPAFNKLPLGEMGPEGTLQVLDEARDQINAVIDMLR